MNQEELTSAIRNELIEAGLTVVDAEAELDAPGVRIEADGDGVWVDWQSGPQVAAAARAVLRRGAYRDGEEMHPAMRHQGLVTEAMNDAIMTILTAVGFDVRKDANEYRTYELLVESHRTVPHWQDPIAAPLDGRSGFMPGVRVRVLVGELAGAELVVGRVRMNLRTNEPMYYQLRHPDRDDLIDVAVDEVEFAGDDGLFIGGGHFGKFGDFDE